MFWFTTRICQKSSYPCVSASKSVHEKTDQIKQLTALVNLLDELSCTKHTTFVCGDFIFPDINWINFKTSFDGINDLFLNTMSSLGMTQFVLEPTRLSSSSSSADNVLDLIFSNDSCSIKIDNIMPPMSTSDHNVIEFTIFLPDSIDNPTAPNATTSHQDISLTSYNWNSANFQAINDALFAIDWHTVFGFNFDVESIWSKFKSIVWPIIDTHVPKTVISHRKKYNPRHYPRENQKLLNRKRPSGENFDKTKPKTWKKNMHQ